MCIVHCIINIHTEQNYTIINDFSNALHLPQNQLVKCQHELVANDIESAIVSVR